MTSLHTEPANHSHDPLELPIEFRVSRNGTPRRRLTLVGKQYTLGNGPDCSVRLDDPTLLPIHATVERRADGLMLRAVARPITVNGGACTQHKLELGDHFSLGSYDFELVPSIEPRQQPQQQPGKGRSEETRSTTPRRRVSFAQSIDLLEKKAPLPKPADSLVSLLAEDSHESQRVRDSQRAILANEKRWQERWQRQQEKHRESQQRSKEQLESLRAAQSSAELRARQAEEMALTLKQQFTELSGKWLTVTNSTVPELQELLARQQKDSIASQTEHQQLVESIRKRLDSIQNSIEEVQAETQALKQHSVFNEEQVRELSEGTSHLEQSLDALVRTQASFEGEATEITASLREELQQASSRLHDIANELDENRTHRDGLRSAIETLQEALEQVQLDAQQSRTIHESLENLESQVMSSETRYAELLSYFDVQNSHFQEEWESLRQRLEWAEQLAGEASRVATELLNRGDNATDIDVPGVSTSDEILRHPTDRGGASGLKHSEIATPAAHLFSPAAHPSSALAPTSRQPSAQRLGADEQYSDSAQHAQANLSNVNSDGFSPLEDSGFGNPNSMCALGDIHLPIPQTGEMPPVSLDLDYSESGIVQPTVDDNRQSLRGVFYPSDFDAPSDELIAEIPHDEIPQIDATMPLSPDVADSISARNSRFFLNPTSNIPFDSASDDEPYHPSDNRGLSSNIESLGSGNDLASVRTSNPSVDGSSAVPSIAASDANSAEEMDEEFDTPSQFAFDDSDNHLGFSGFARLEPPLPGELIPGELGYEEASDDDSDDDIVLTDKTADEKPLYSPPRTRSATEILAAMGISVEEDVEEGKSHRVSMDSLGENSLEATASVHENIGGSASERTSISSRHASENSHEGDEESIEDYMNRLLNRVQGTSVAQSNHIAEPAELSTTRTTISRSRPTTSTPREASKTEDGSSANSIHSSTSGSITTAGPDGQNLPPESPASPEEYIPRRSAPEKPAKLAALRELANSTARQAIASSARRRLAKEALFKLSIFGVGMIASLTTLAGSRFSLDHWMVISVCCFLLSLFFLWESLNIRKRLLSTNAGVDEPRETVAEPTEATA